MRDIVVSEFISLDGVIEDPGGAESFEHGGWTFRFPGQEMYAFKLEEVMAADTLLLGRVTYEGFAAAWPGRSDEAGFADKFNGMEKVVVSTTLERADWNNSTIVRDDVVARLRALKETEGGDVLVNGSRTLVRTLLENDLVDELRLCVFPVTLGSGMRLYPDGVYRTFELAEARTFDSGVVLLRYRTPRERS